MRLTSRELWFGADRYDMVDPTAPSRPHGPLSIEFFPGFLRVCWRFKLSFFQAALQDMERKGLRWRDPQALSQYAQESGLEQPKKTADLLSVQSWSQLDPELRAAGVMIFRLGVGSAQSAHFALARADKDLAAEMFLRDEELFACAEEVFIPDASARDLYPYQLLGRVNEDGAVDLSVASGLLGEVLGLDQPFPRVAPARTASAFTFDVRPHSSYAQVCWNHRSGQVEVDAAFLARRGGKWKLFVIEAKSGPPEKNGRLPKYKLVYSASVLAQRRLPPDIELIPVYLRSWQDKDLSHIHYAVVECELGDRDKPIVSELTPKAARRFVMPFGGMVDLA